MFLFFLKKGKNQPRYRSNVHHAHACTGMYPVCYVWGMSEWVYIHHQAKLNKPKPTDDTSLRLKLQPQKIFLCICEGHQGIYQRKIRTIIFIKSMLVAANPLV